MRLAQRILAVVSLTTFVALLLACGSVKVGPLPSVSSSSSGSADEGPPSDNPQGGPIGPVDSGPPVVVAAQQLAQEFYDDPNGTFSRYMRKKVEVKGTVHEQRLPNGLPITAPGNDIGGLVFRVQVTDKATQKKMDKNIYFNFRNLIKPGDAKAALVEKGKTVTLRAQMTGVDLGSKQASFNNAVIVSEEAGATKP
jgi:hypothetical protein